MSNPAFSVSVLGPLRAGRDGRPLPLRSARQRALLGLLALGAGEPVSRHRLTEAMWGAAEPANPGNALQVQISRLRAQLFAGRPGVLTATAQGYRLDLTPEQCDLLAFRKLVAEAGGAAPVVACNRYREALRLWRGDAVADVEPLYDAPSVAALAEERIAAVLALCDAARRIGRSAIAVSFLRPLAAERPLHGALHAELMVALAAAGRQADALDVFTAIRRRLGEELGLDPDPPLEAALRQILRRRPDQLVCTSWSHHR
jgi:DNA-binding SARP family transcriptional activator